MSHPTKRIGYTSYAYRKLLRARQRCRSQRHIFLNKNRHMMRMFRIPSFPPSHVTGCPSLSLLPTQTHQPRAVLHCIVSASNVYRPHSIGFAVRDRNEQQSTEFVTRQRRSWPHLEHQYLRFRRLEGQEPRVLLILATIYVAGGRQCLFLCWNRPIAGRNE